MLLYSRLQNIPLAASIGLAYTELVSICSRAFFSNKEQTPPAAGHSKLIKEPREKSSQQAYQQFNSPRGHQGPLHGH